MFKIRRVNGRLAVFRVPSRGRETWEVYDRDLLPKRKPQAHTRKSKVAKRGAVTFALTALMLAGCSVDTSSLRIAESSPPPQPTPTATIAPTETPIVVYQPVTITQVVTMYQTLDNPRIEYVFIPDVEPYCVEGCDKP